MFTLQNIANLQGRGFTSDFRFKIYRDLNKSALFQFRFTRCICLKTTKRTQWQKHLLLCNYFLERGGGGGGTTATTTTTSKSRTWFYEHIKSSERASHFLVVVSTAQLRRETASLGEAALCRTWRYDHEFSFLFLNLKVLRNLTPGEIAYIWQIESLQ